jgi:hypothetical protein
MPSIRVAPKGAKSIYLECGVWYDDRLRNPHHCTRRKRQFHALVSNRPGSTA